MAEKVLQLLLITLSHRGEDSNVQRLKNMSCKCRKRNQVDVHLHAAFNELDIVDMRAVSIQNHHSMFLDSAFWPGLWFKDFDQPVQCDPSRSVSSLGVCKIGIGILLIVDISMVTHQVGT